VEDLGVCVYLAERDAPPIEVQRTLSPRMYLDAARRLAFGLLEIFWSTAHWRKVGDAANYQAEFVAKLLTSLALPRGLEPLFSP
jgi:hypothetical protein